MIRLVVPTLPPSGTVYHRLHWGAKKRWRETFATETLIAALDAGWEFREKKYTPAMKVSIVVYRRRLLDEDNLVAGTKPLLDGMRDIGLLRNDSPRWCSLDVKQIRERDEQRTEITLTKRNSKPKGERNKF